MLSHFFSQVGFSSCSLPRPSFFSHSSFLFLWLVLIGRYSICAGFSAIAWSRRRSECNEAVLVSGSPAYVPVSDACSVAFAECRYPFFIHRGDMLSPISGNNPLNFIICLLLAGGDLYGGIWGGQIPLKKHSASETCVGCSVLLQIVFQPAALTFRTQVTYG